MLKHVLILFVLAAMAFPAGAQTDSTSASASPLSGYWFECEFARRTTPPHDECLMLDDDGVLFNNNRVRLVKVTDSPETDACHKHRAGQCFRADRIAVKIKYGPSGKIISSNSGNLVVRVFGCRQSFDLRAIGAYYEIRAADNGSGQCWWTRPLMKNGYKYVRPYNGEVGE